MRTVVDDVAELGQARNYAPMNQSGTEGESWMLTDFFDVVVHVFNQESRMFYDLDGLWGDAKRVEWADGAEAATSARAV